jgi:hypothetical protein
MKFVTIFIRRTLKSCARHNPFKRHKNVRLLRIFTAKNRETHHELFRPIMWPGSPPELLVHSIGTR